jgi:hypothetical protein
MTFDDPTLFDLAGDKLLPHLEHKISLTAHGGDAAPDSIAVECEDRCEVLIDFLPEPRLRPLADSSRSPDDSIQEYSSMQQVLDLVSSASSVSPRPLDYPSLHR